MKSIVIVFLISGLFACSKVLQDSSAPQSIEIESKRPLPRVVVAGYTIELLDFNGMCVVKARKVSEKIDNETRLTMGMKAPCEFIRDNDTHNPQTHIYQTSLKRRTVLVITGGPPSPERKDEYMPEGCGTELQKIILFDDHIEIGPPPDPKYRNYAPRCPSLGLDEVHFAV